MHNIYIALLILAAVQGVAEFLPVSSSGHLVLFGEIDFLRDSINVIAENSELFINVSLHIATLIAVLIYLRKDISAILKGAFSGIKEKNYQEPGFRSVIYILAASVPAGLIGILFNDYIEVLFTSEIVSYMLIINGFILLSTKIIPLKDRKLDQIGVMRAIFTGLFQAVAIIPGISRSGMTITGGMISGLAPEESARFSFLMAIPVIAGAGLLEFVKIAGKGFPDDLIFPLIAAMIIAVIVALISLKILFILVKKVRIDIFGYYTILAGILGVVYMKMF